jgi:sugar lactone lactonase YvrE
MPSHARHLRATARLVPGLVALAVMSIVPATTATSPDRIDLPRGWQPEGITTDGSSLFVGSLADGAIWKVDVASGTGEVLVPGSEGVVAVGLDVEAGARRLWVAGGATGQVRAYDLSSGEPLETYPVSAGFLNDVAVTEDAVYVTDSFMPQVLVIPLGADGSLTAPEEAFALPISGELEYRDGFNVNGIVATDAGLVVVHSGTGELYLIDPASGRSVRIDTGDVVLTDGDGLELSHDTLYVVRNRANVVTVLELDADASATTSLSELTSDDLAVPTTAALVGPDLWAVNARFGVPAPSDADFWITRLDADPSAEG